MPDTVACCLRTDGLPGELPDWHTEDSCLGNYVGGLVPLANGEWVVDNAAGAFSVDRRGGDPRRAGVRGLAELRFAG